MDKSVKVVASLLIIIIAAVAVVTYIDIYNESDMQINAQPCGWASSTAGRPYKSCECDGRLTNNNAKINPLLLGTGGLKYYCYGQCSDCRCYVNEEETDCTRLEQELGF